MLARFRWLILSAVLCLVACPAPPPQNGKANLLQLPWGKPWALQIEGDRAYVAHGQGGLVTVDLPQGRVLSRFGGFNVVDIRQPQHPRRLAHFQQGNYRDSDAWDNQTAYQSLGHDGKRLYVTDYYSGLQIWSR